MPEENVNVEKSTNEITETAVQNKEIAEETASSLINDKEAAIRADIEKMKAAIVDMQEKGESLFAEEIKNLQQKINNAEDELKAAAENKINEVQTEVDSWWNKHKVDIFNYGKIAVLIYIAYRLTV